MKAKQRLLDTRHVARTDIIIQQTAGTPKHGGEFR